MISNVKNAPLHLPVAARHHHLRPPVTATSGHNHSTIRQNPHRKPPNKAAKLAESLSHIVNLRIETAIQKTFHRPSLPSLDDKYDTPTSSPREDISATWRELHGSRDWNNLLDPLDPSLRREIVKYGELAQATYDALDTEPTSEYCGGCRYSRRRLLSQLGLDHSGYDVTKYIYATSSLVGWLERTPRPVDGDSNWMGFVAVSGDEESRRIGRRDVAVAWRGTVAPSEWYDNMQSRLEPVGRGDAMVEHGFLSIYSSKSRTSRYNRLSASEQAMVEVQRLVNHYRALGEEVSLTVTGHSLGGALAQLNAYEAAANFPGLPVSVISFAAPRVGNIAFRDELYQMGVKTLRLTIRQDVVPRMPGIVFNEGLQRFDELTGTLEWVYTHAGVELRLDARASPYLKKGLNPIGFHMLETYLHLVDGFSGSGSGFRAEAKRDVALVNKDCDMLVDELRVPVKWYQPENKGLQRNRHGRWVKPVRKPEDEPEPDWEEEGSVYQVY